MENKKTRRKPITKKLRFEVFKRDAFTCQYCGRMAPDVILEVDHINPVSNGGDNDIMNLITSCKDCNRGKGKRKLSSCDEIKIQQQQLKELSQKREQLKMLIEWRKELSKLDDMQIDAVESIFSDKASVSLTETGRKNIGNFIKKYGFENVCESVEIYISQYFNPESKEFSREFGFIGRICYNREMQSKDPSIYWSNKIAYYCNKKFPYVEKWKARNLVKGKIKSDEECEYIISLIDFYRSWSDVKSAILEAIQCQQ